MNATNEKYFSMPDRPDNEAAVRRTLEEIISYYEENPREAGTHAGEIARLPRKPLDQAIITSNSGINSDTVDIIVAFGPAIVHVFITIWDDLIMPKLRSRLSANDDKSE